MPAIGPTLKPSLLATMLAASTLLSGCGGSLGDYVDLQGGVFDGLGVSSATQKPKTEAKAEARPGLVLPPDPEKLPAPGSGVAEVADAGAWPIDPEEGKARAKAETDRRQKEFCDKALANARIAGQDNAVIMGPYGNCRPGLFGQLGTLFDPKKDDTGATR